MTDFGFNQFSLADMFDGEVFTDELKALSSDSPSKKNKTKEGTKTEKKKTGSSKKKPDPEVSLPCKVVAPGFETTIDGEGTIVGSELVKKIIDAGYTELSACENKLFIPDDIKNSVYVVPETLGIVTDGDSLIDLTEEKQVMFAYGMEKASYSLSDFPDAEDNEVTLSMVAEKIGESFPRYKGLELSYDPESSVVCIHSDGAKKLRDKDKVSYPLTVIVKGEEVTKLEGPETASELIKELTSDFAHTKLSVSLAKSGLDNTYLLIFSAYGNTVKATEKSNAGAKAQKKEEKFKLPFEACVVYASYKETLTTDMFDGKEKLTKNDLVEYYKNKGFSLFTNEKMVSKLNCSYDKGLNLVSLEFVAGTRGFINRAWAFEETEKYATPHLSSSDVDECLSTDRTSYDCIIDCDNKYPNWSFFQLFANAHSYFVHDEVELRDAGLKKRIPKEILDGIISYFKECLPYEAICRIVYNKTGYYIQLPAEEVHTCNTVTAVSYPQLNPNENVVMEIHSHNIMKAFWSHTDNEAESGTVGIYGVVGRLNTKSPDILCRAFFNEMTCPIPLEKLFEV